MFKYYVSIVFYSGLIVSFEIGNLEIQKTLFAQYLEMEFRYSKFPVLVPNVLRLFYKNQKRKKEKKKLLETQKYYVRVTW